MRRQEPILDRALRSAHISGKSELADFKGKLLDKNAAVPRQYIRYRTNVPIHKDIIFYEVMSGSRMGDNPYGIFEYLKSRPDYDDYLHVWSVARDATVPEEYKSSANVFFARRNTAAYAYFLACAGHVICNANLPDFFARRPDQLYLETWHGIPYKSLGRNAPSARFGSVAGNSTFLKATHLLTPCDFMADELLSGYSMRGASNATLAELGYPRVDLTVDATSEECARLRERLGITTADDGGSYRPTVLYAPTWRDEKGKDVIDSEQLTGDLEALAKLDVQLIYRGHHRMNRLLKDGQVGDQIANVIIPPHEISSNELLTVVDVLITDYSSIFFDFLPTGRPIVHYLYDLEHYKRTRGLTLETDELPGTVALEQSELTDAVAAAADQVKAAGFDRSFRDEPLQGEPYRRAQLRFCPHEDGHSSRRAAEFFFNGTTGDFPTRGARDGRTTAVFWAGSLTETADHRAFYQALIESGRSSDEQTVLIIEKRAPIDKNVLKVIKQLGDEISTLSYVSTDALLLLGEEPGYNRFLSDKEMNRGAITTILKRNSMIRGILSHEYRRRLDDSQFDKVTTAPGLSNFELALATLADRRSSLPGGKRVKPRSSQPCTSQDLTKRATVERIAESVMPKGSKRRRLVGRGYRAGRRQLEHLFSKRSH